MRETRPRVEGHGGRRWTAAAFPAKRNGRCLLTVLPRSLRLHHDRTAAALPAFKLVDSRTYTVDTDQAESVAPPTQVSMKQTPYAYFGIFVTRENQDRMLDLPRENAPKSLTTPGLLTIDFHRSIDGLQVINLGVWTTFDDFNSFTQQPGFRDDNLYWEGVAGGLSQKD